jgi:peroxiredoxin Q/BCP
VLGVSPDDLASHARFRAKYHLDFPLLADVDRRVSEAYGAWREKRNLVGAMTMGLQRSTYLVDESGKVARVWPKVQVEGHDAEVLAALG